MGDDKLWITRWEYERIHGTAIIVDLLGESAQTQVRIVEYSGPYFQGHSGGDC